MIAKRKPHPHPARRVPAPKTPPPLPPPPPPPAPLPAGVRIVTEPVDLPRGWWRGLVYRAGIPHCVYGCVEPTEADARKFCERWARLAYPEVPDARD